MRAFTNIVCGLDLSSGDVIVGDEPLSPASSAALSTAVHLAQANGAALHLVTGLDLDDAARAMLAETSGSGAPTVDRAAEERLRGIADDCAARGVRATYAVALGSPPSALLDDVARNGRDLVVVGTRERGAVARNLLGSTSLKLLRRAPVAVWVARGNLGLRPPNVLAAIDLGDMAPAIVAKAARIAASADGRLHVLHVVDYAAESVLRLGAADAPFVEEYRRRKRAHAEAHVPALVEAAAGRYRADVHLRFGDVNSTIVGVAEELHIDVVVLGSVVHSALGAAISGLGRTAEHLLAHVLTSMLVLKSPGPR